MGIKVVNNFIVSNKSMIAFKTLVQECQNNLTQKIKKELIGLQINRAEGKR